MQLFNSRVVVVNDYGEEYYQLILEKERDISFLPGEFVYVKDQNSPDLLRRPFSVASESDSEFSLLIKEVGSMSKRLRNVSAGENLDILGPLGNSFDLSGEKKAVLVGGGVGMAPLLRLTQEFENSGRDYIILLGFRDACEPAQLFAQDKLCIHRESIHEGFVTNFLEGMLSEEVEVFTCGPTPMLQSVREMCLRKGVPVQLSLEEKMACGIGSCIGCVVEVRNDSGTVYKKVCKDGPVFRGEELAWE